MKAGKTRPIVAPKPPGPAVETMQTNFPRHFAEPVEMPQLDLDSLPDLFVAETLEELRELISCYGWEFIGDLPNLRDGFITVRIRRGARQERVLAANHPFHGRESTTTSSS